MLKRMMFLLLLLSLGMGSIQAQATCDLQTADEFILRGNEFYANSDYTAAIADYDCANAIAPSFEANYNLGITYYWLGNYDAAILAFSAAIELNPDDLNTRDFRASLFMEQGRYPEALAEFNSILEVDSENASAYLSRAWVYVYMGSEEGTKHADFLRWMQLEESSSFEVALADVLNYESLPIATGQTYYISFEAEAEQSFSAAASSQEYIDPLLVLVAPDGTPVASDDDGGSNLNAVISRFELPQTGTYTLVLGQAGASGTGDIELSLIIGSRLVSTDGTNTSDVRSDFAAYNLFVGDVAEIFTTEGDSLNLRAEPSTEAEILDRLAFGEIVTLLEGPRKEGGYSWWRVRNAEGIEGWSVERVETEQTLQLALLQGENAFVITLDEYLNVRANPSRDAELLFQLGDGERVTLLDEAPVVDGGFRWWHIQTADGRQGWSVDRIGVERTLAPAREFPNR